MYQILFQILHYYLNKIIIVKHKQMQTKHKFYLNNY